MQQHLTRQESLASAPSDMSFNLFLSKEILLQQLIDISNGIRIYFGERNGERSFVAVSANSFDMVSDDEVFINTNLENENRFLFGIENATRISCRSVDFRASSISELRSTNRMLIPQMGSEIPSDFQEASPSAWFTKEDIMNLLNTQGCIGLRVFPGTAGIHEDDNNLKLALMSGREPTNDPEVLEFFPTLIATAVDSDGRDMETSMGEFPDKPYTMSLLPCPPKCGQGDTSINPDEF